MAITDLFRPKWKHSDAGVRKPAVEKLTDEGILSDVAQNDPDHGVRLAAVSKLSDRHGLARILHKESEASVWQAALARISDQTLLAEISRTTPRAMVRAAVVKKLMSPSVLAERLKGDDDAGVRLAALEKVSDQAAIAGAARSDKDPAVRTAAVKKIKTDSILAEILSAERDASIQRIILDEMKDHAILGKIAQDHPVPKVRAAASKKLAELLRATIMLDDSARAITLLGIAGDHHLDPDKDGWTPLHCAAFKGDLEVLELLLGKGSSPDTRDNRNKWTSLHYVAAHGHSRLVAPLIKAGADPNAVSGPDRNTPLHIAVAMGYPPGYLSSLKNQADVFGRETDAAKRQDDLRKLLQSHPQVVSELLKCGANPNALTGQGRTPLHLLAEGDDIQCAEVLVAGGSDLDAKGAQEATALHWAAAKRNGKFGKWLVDKGAQPDLADALGWTPLFLADANGTTDLIPVLLAAGARTEATINGRPAAFQGLATAAREGSIETVRALIAAGVDVNAKESDGRTPLIHASLNGHLDVTQALIASGADANATMADKITALYVAAQNGHVDIVKALLGAGADVNARQDSGATALFMAAQDGHLAVVQALLAAGADVNPKLASGGSALTIATYNGHAEVVRALLQANAPPNEKLADGTTAYSIALGMRHQEIVELLQSHGGCVGTAEELIEAVEAGNFTAAKAALGGGANVNFRSRDGWTPLLTASKDYPQIVELLLANNADPNLASNQGYTPLMRAAGNGAERIVRLLLAAGSDKRLIDCNGKNAYQLSMEMGQRACAQLVR